MIISKKENLVYQKPNSKNDEDYQYSSSAKVFQTKQLFLYSERVEAGKTSSAPHFHKSIDEIVVITKGELYAFEGEEETLLKAGDSLCFIANSKKKHYLENRSQEASEFLLFRKSVSKNDVVY